MKDCSTCKWEPDWFDYASPFAKWQEGSCKFPLPVCVEKSKVSKCINSKYAIYQFAGGEIENCSGWKAKPNSE